MKNKLIAVAATLAVTLIATFAFAQEARIDVYRFTPQWFTAGVYVGPEAAPNVAATRDNRVTRILGGNYTVNFAVAQTITCVDSGNLTLTGARTGDLCLVTPPADGASANASFTCRVSAADTVLIRFCAHGTAATPGSDTYRVNVISNQ